MKPLIIRQSRWRLGLLALFFLCLSTGSGIVLTVLSNSQGTKWASLIPFGAGMLLFGIVAVMSLNQACSSLPHMRLDDEGIFDYNLKTGLLPWSEITGAHVRQMLNQKNVQLELRSPEQCRRRQPWPLRLLSAYSLAMGVSPFILYTSYTNTSADTVVDYVSQQLQQRQIQQANSGFFI